MVSGRTCIVTGASTGIGREIARSLAAQGARVIMACRDEARGIEARDDVRRSSGNPGVELRLVDLSRQSDIRRFAADVLDREGRVHVLVNNAGVWPTKKQSSADGLELTFATNVLGYHLTTNLLLERLKESAPARIVNVASDFAGGLDLDDLQFERRPFDGAAAYRQSKQANRMLSWTLAAALQGTGVTVNAAHPGSVDTRLNRDFTGIAGFVWRRAMRIAGRTPAKGAAGPAWLASSPEVEGVSGKYWKDRRERDCKFRDPSACRVLWERCETLTKINS